MDRLKFRCWHKKRKRMYKVLHLHLKTVFNGGDWVTAEGFNIITQQEVHIQIEPEDCVIMQCTGMKDDKDKLIYEGDIVEIWKMCGNIRKRMFVKWRETQCSFRLYDASAMGATPQKITDKRSMGAVTSIKVIGNIYENPELLEVEQCG